MFYKPRHMEQSGLHALVPYILLQIPRLLQSQVSVLTPSSEPPKAPFPTLLRSRRKPEGTNPFTGILWITDGVCHSRLRHRSNARIGELLAARKFAPELHQLCAALSFLFASVSVPISGPSFLDAFEQQQHLTSKKHNSCNKLRTLWRVT